MKYIKQLDSLRAIAVLLVIVHHWTPLRNPMHTYTAILNGVDIFFVLSGFLITNILLQNRNNAEQLQLPKSTIVKSFYIRRVLRIFPIYYLLLIGLLLFAGTTGTTIKENFIYYATYTVNIYFFNIQGWDGMLSHLWSLSVEEQFYLFWPWLMLFTKKRWLLPVIVFSFGVGLVAQLLLPHAGLLTFSCLDAFGAGAFLAWLLVYNPQVLVRTKLLWPILAAVSFGLQLLLMFGYPVQIPSRTLTALITLWVIVMCVKKQQKAWLFNVVFNNPILVFLGKISYGIYLYHLIIPHYTYDFLYNINRLLPDGISKYHFYVYRLQNLALVILAAYLSWWLIEQPVLQLKKHFKYRKSSATNTKKVVYQSALTGETMNN